MYIYVWAYIWCSTPLRYDVHCNLNCIIISNCYHYMLNNIFKISSLKNARWIISVANTHFLAHSWIIARLSLLVNCTWLICWMRNIGAFHVVAQVRHFISRCIQSLTIYPFQMEWVLFDVDVIQHSVSTSYLALHSKLLCRVMSWWGTSGSTGWEICGFL